jgi:dethiobiotin synthetase
MPSFFVTGTDTGVGKTHVTSWLVRGWLALGHHAAALKPISTGDRNDATRLREASAAALSLDEINPAHFLQPAAPLLAARAENRVINFTALNQAIHSAAARFSHLAVEGVGGWRVPLAPDYDVRDWARDLGFPVVVVARGTLGTLNHTRLTVDSIRDAGLPCAGVIVNAGPHLPARDRSSPDLDLAWRDNVLLLRELLRLPVLDLVHRVQTPRHVPLWLGGKEI